jgi:hypothetical protein
MISKFFTVTIAVSRKVWTGNTATDTPQGSFSGHVQQSSPEFAESIGQAWGKTFSIWCAIGTDVAEGDTLTVASGDYAGTYSVKNVQKNATGINEHLELVVIKDV